MGDNGEIETREIVKEDSEDRKVIHTQYWKNGEMIAADVTVVIKKMPELFGTTIPDGIPLEN